MTALISTTFALLILSSASFAETPSACSDDLRLKFSIETEHVVLPFPKTPTRARLETNEKLVLQGSGETLQIDLRQPGLNSVGQFVHALELMQTLPASPEKAALLSAAFWRCTHSLQYEAPTARTDLPRLVYLSTSLFETSMSPDMNRLADMLIKSILVGQASAMTPVERDQLLTAFVDGLGQKGRELFGSQYDFILQQWRESRGRRMG